MEDNTQKFEDADSYSYSYDKNKISFKDICLLHLKKIGDHASCEFRGGYWQPKETPIGQGQSVTQYIYVPDSREIYSNSAEYFADILFPYYDKDMKAAFEDAEKELKKAYEDNTILKEKTREDENEEESKEYRRSFGNDTNKLTYRDLRVKINRKLFRELCCFLYRRKYLELGAIED